jgi:hypothetical protein
MHRIMALEREPFMEDYNRALEATSRRDWPDLRRGLSSPNADQVAIALRNFIESDQKYQMYLTIYINFRDNPRDFMDSLRDELRLRRELDALISSDTDTDTLSVSDCDSSDTDTLSVSDSSDE